MLIVSEFFHISETMVCFFYMAFIYVARIHAANNMIWFYLKYNKLDRSGTDQTSIKGPVKITYNKFISNLAKQEDTTSLALC